MASPPVSTHTESDAEHTAEMPVFDPKTHAHAGEHRMSQTDTWIAPAPPARPTEGSAPATRAAEAPPPTARLTEAPPAAARQAELALQALSAKLHEAQELLAAKGARLTQAERARDEALAARPAARPRAPQPHTAPGPGPAQTTGPAG